MGKTFEQALPQLKRGNGIRRESWPENAIVMMTPGEIHDNDDTKVKELRLPVDDDEDVVLAPHFIHYNGNKTHMGWLPSTEEILAWDWEFIELDKQPE